MEQRLVQADWTSADNSPETKDKEEAISKLSTQVEEQVSFTDSVVILFSGLHVNVWLFQLFVILSF